jgi:hypothetical protein
MTLFGLVHHKRSSNSTNEQAYNEQALDVHLHAFFHIRYMEEQIMQHLTKLCLFFPSLNIHI